MTYLMTQMWLCLLLAALLGFLLGWFLRGARCKRELEELEASWKARLEEAEAACRKKVADLEASWKGRLEEAEASAAKACDDRVGKIEADWKGKLEKAEADAEKAVTAKASEVEGVWLAKLQKAEADAKAGTEAKIADLEGTWKGKLEKAEADAKAGCEAKVADLEASWKGRLDGCQAELASAQKALEDAESDSGNALVAGLSGAAVAVAATSGDAPSGDAGPAMPHGLMSSPGGEKRKDDLKKVEGIGPKIEGLLNDAGVFTWAGLAQTAVDFIQEVLDKAGPRYRVHDPATWPDQARLAAEGRWEELEELQDRLQGGRDG